jgi:2-polyprenyl-3-methyl-5-hydroxy-6-metoxy-1,4-benzoquinol methylase
MERADWLKQMRSKAEALYDRISSQYWMEFGLTEDDTHQAYLRKFLKRVAQGSCGIGQFGGSKPGIILSAGCGAGRYDGLLLEAGHTVIGIDQSGGMLRQAREHFPEERFPQLRYEKVSLQEIAMTPAFQEAFDGIICIDAMEHICPEDYPGILRGFQEALKPGAVLYFTADTTETADSDEVDIEVVYERAKSLGLPVVYGEWVDEISDAYEQVMAMAPGQPVPGNLADRAVYHYYPPVQQVRVWIDLAGLEIEEEGLGSGWHHFVVSKKFE